MLSHKYREKTLVVESCSDGPWVPVVRLGKVVVRDALKNDVVELCFRGDDLVSTPESRSLRGSGEHHFDFPKGEVMIKRVRGTTPITVLALCTRLNPNGAPTIK